MVAIIRTNGRLLVDNMEIRSLSIDVVQTRVLHVARVARAVNCGEIEAQVIDMSERAVNEASLHSWRYDVKPYARSLTSVTAKVPLLLYRDSRGAIILIDGRQRAAKAFQTRDHVKAYVVSETDAVSVGVHPFSSETIQLLNIIKDPALRARVVELFRRLGGLLLSSPILDSIKMKAEANGDVELLALLKRLMTSMVEQDDYKLLKTTRPHPVLFDKEPGKDAARSTHGRIVQSAHYQSEKRPKDGRYESIVKAFYGYQALEVCILEELIKDKASKLNLYLGYYDGNTKLAIDDYKSNPGGKDLRNISARRLEAYDKFLRNHWRHIRLIDFEKDQIFQSPADQFSVEDDRNLYPYFGTIQQNAGEIIRGASVFTSVERLKEAMKKRVDDEAKKGGQALRSLRDTSVQRLHLYAKAFVRVRHWRSAKIALLDMENSAGSVGPREVENTARRDLDRKPSLVTLDEMCIFSYQTGIPATAIWPLNLEFNAFFECAALVLPATSKGEERPMQATPTVIENYTHRRSIQDSKETDGHSIYWDNLFMALDIVGVSRDIMAEMLTILDAIGGMDQFDREENPYG